MVDLIPQTSLTILDWNGFSFLHSINPYLLLGVIIVLCIWSLAWKGIALWYAAKHRQKKWFVVMLVINTVGILEILYLLSFCPEKDDTEHTLSREEHV